MRVEYSQLRLIACEQMRKEASPKRQERGKDMSRGKRIAILAINVFIAVMVVVAWAMLAFGSETDTLAARGVRSLKYFTVLSNLLLGAASLVYAICQVRCLRGTSPEIPRAAHVLKYVATTAVGVTFLTVMLFLGPLMGYPLMFKGANFWLHLVLPVLAILECCVLDGPHELNLRDNLVAVMPTLVYGIGYVGNILVNGVGAGTTNNDWYGFTLWGVDKIPLVLLVMLLVTFLIGLVIRLANKHVALRRAVR